MTGAYWLRGDTRRTLAEMADGGLAVDLALCSPPFLALRSYLPADDPDKALEMGSEQDPGAYLDGLLDVIEALDRVLAPHGSLAVELGDTFAGSGGAGGDYADGGLRDGQPAFTGSASRTRSDGNGKVYRGGSRLPDAMGAGWPAPKSLALIPELFRVACAYGVNPLTGRTTPRWRVRNVVRWVRPNPAVGADGDKFRPATSDIAVLCRTDEAGRTRYWDGDAVRTAVRPDHERGTEASAGKSDRATVRTANPAGAPLLDWWRITGAGYPGSHYATWPPAVVEPLIKAMAPHRVCTVCGQPSRRIVSEPTYERTDSQRVPARLTMNDGDRPADGVRQFTRTDGANTSVVRHVETVGWTDCGHGDAWRPGIVLDPFAGSGTTLAVATGHGRTAIGIDLDRRNTDLARDRVGPMFFHETTVPDLAATLTGRALDGAA
jgi:hypothetical protein